MIGRIIEEDPPAAIAHGDVAAHIGTDEIAFNNGVVLSVEVNTLQAIGRNDVARACLRSADQITSGIKRVITFEEDSILPVTQSLSAGDIGADEISLDGVIGVVEIKNDAV